MRRTASTNNARGQLRIADLEGRLLCEIAQMGGRRVHNDTLLLIDPADVRKLYAKKMEYLATVRDPREIKF